MRHRPSASTRPRQVRVERHTQVRPAARPRTPDRLRVAVLEPAGSEALLAMLGRCSALTLYRRFDAATDGVSYFQHVLADAAGHDSYSAWSGDRCVGLGNLHVGAVPAEIGVLVEDGCQRRGVGTAFVVELVRRDRDRRSPFLRADLLADNRFALQAPASVGPRRTTWAHGSHTALIDLRPGSARAQHPSVTTPGATLPVQTVYEAVVAATTRSVLDGLS